VQVSWAEPRFIQAHLIGGIEQGTFDQRLLTLITRLFERLEKLWPEVSGLVPCPVTLIPILNIS